VIDFPAILDIVRAAGHDVLPAIEIAAQATRTIPLLDPGWWSTYPSRDATQLFGPLAILWSKGRAAAEPYSSAWERGDDGAAVIAEEWSLVERSVSYFRRLLTASPGAVRLRERLRLEQKTLVANASGAAVAAGAAAASAAADDSAAVDDG
jgi:hypothetical protein